MQKRGLPTVTLLSSAFAPLGRLEAQFFGLKHLPVVEIPHRPWGSVRPEEFHADAEAALPQLVAILTEAAAVSAR